MRIHAVVPGAIHAVAGDLGHRAQRDDQLARARFAEHQGVGACVRVRDIYRLSAWVERLLQPDERRRIAERCAALDQSNGAVELASFIEEMAYSRRVDRP